MNVGEIVATLKARDESFTAGMDRAAAATKRLEAESARLHRELTRAANTMAVVAGVAMVTFGKAALTAAVNAEEAASAFQTVFGSAAAAAGQFVEEFANKAGMANYELQQMMAITGNAVQGLGATADESLALSERMVTLAGDIASFSNAQGGAQAVLHALQSAINGEREALKTYGLAVSEAEVQTKAFEMTGKTSADELTRLDKALATVEIAYGKAAMAVGDLDRTQQSSANQLRQVRAGFEELKVSVGNALVPIAGGLIPALKGVMDFAAKVPAMTTALGTAVVVLGGAAAAAKMLKLELSAARMAALGLVGAIAGLAIYGAGQGTLMRDWAQALEDLAPAIMEGGEALEAFRDHMIDLGFSAHDIDPLIRRMREELPQALDRVGRAIESAVRDLFPDWVEAEEEAARAAAELAKVHGMSADDISTAWDNAQRELLISLQRGTAGLGDAMAAAEETARAITAALDQTFGGLPGIIAQHEGDYAAALGHLLQAGLDRIQFEKDMQTLGNLGFDALVGTLREGADDPATQEMARYLVSAQGLAMAAEWEQQHDIIADGIASAMTPPKDVEDEYRAYGQRLRAAVLVGYGIPTLPPPRVSGSAAGTIISTVGGAIDTIVGMTELGKSGGAGSGGGKGGIGSMISQAIGTVVGTAQQMGLITYHQNWEAAQGGAAAAFEEVRDAALTVSDAFRAASASASTLREYGRGGQPIQDRLALAIQLIDERIRQAETMAALVQGYTEQQWLSRVAGFGVSAADAATIWQVAHGGEMPWEPGRADRVRQSRPMGATGGVSAGKQIVVNVGQAVGDETSVERMVVTAMRRARLRGDS